MEKVHKPTKEEIEQHQWLKPKQQSMDEIHDIIIALRGGTGKNDGDYRSSHLGIILEYLKTQKREDKRLTLQKLALKIGMSQRQIRENYFDGLIAFGVLGLTSQCDVWYWIGKEALTKHEGEL